MKLRHDKGKPIIVLEAGDVACLERAAGLLAGASVHVGEFPDGALQDLADGIRRVLNGEVPGVQLPKKRKAKEADTTDQEPGESHVIEEPPAEEPPPTCEACGSILSPREARAGKFCRQHAPSTEAVA